MTFRDPHERPEGMDAGTLIVAPLGKVDLVEAVRAVRDGYGEGRRFAGAVPDYQGGAVSTKVVRIVLSYIDQVNHTVWSKPGPF
ncbi:MULTISPECIES: UDP-N-acetyl glucosamine 2-epimerase [Methylorubrum]|uniref:UDP-N-acetylglucosamine 2-epimerase-like protein n=1 Tax=Methylorubrum extorquens (strain ATCC 14718 / DSM 1338 / JCM 2805 / NCIMB 9133 / AM1) TaxID=272630 RepID=C5B279_METEA